MIEYINFKTTTCDHLQVKLLFTKLTNIYYLCDLQEMGGLALSEDQIFQSIKGPIYKQLYLIKYNYFVYLQNMSHFKNKSNVYKILQISMQTELPESNSLDYIRNLQQKIQFQHLALTTAQSLIENYRLENETLNRQKQQINDMLKQSEKKIEVLEMAIRNISYNQKSFVELENKITSLQEIKYHYEQRQKELIEKISELNKKMHTKENSQIKRENLSIYDIRKQILRKDIQDNFNQYFKKYKSKNLGQQKFHKLKVLKTQYNATEFEPFDEIKLNSSSTRSKTCTQMEYKKIKPTKTVRKFKGTLIWK